MSNDQNLDFNHSNKFIKNSTISIQIFNNDDVKNETIEINGMNDIDSNQYKNKQKDNSERSYDVIIEKLNGHVILVVANIIMDYCRQYVIGGNIICNFDVEFLDVITISEHSIISMSFKDNTIYFFDNYGHVKIYTTDGKIIEQYQLKHSSINVEINGSNFVRCYLTIDNKNSSINKMIVCGNGDEILMDTESVLYHYVSFKNARHIKNIYIFNRYNGEFLRKFTLCTYQIHKQKIFIDTIRTKLSDNIDEALIMVSILPDDTIEITIVNIIDGTEIKRSTIKNKEKKKKRKKYIYEKIKKIKIYNTSIFFITRNNIYTLNAISGNYLIKIDLKNNKKTLDDDNSSLEILETLYIKNVEFFDDHIYVFNKCDILIYTMDGNFCKKIKIKDYCESDIIAINNDSNKMYYLTNTRNNILIGKMNVFD